MTGVTIVSFGYLHGPPPVADIVVDLRQRMRDPHTDPAFRELTGAHPDVQAKVRGTRGARQLVHSLAHFANAMVVAGQPLTVAVGCAGGRHRSYVVAEWVGELLDFHGARVVHRDVHLPVKKRPGQRA